MTDQVLDILKLVLLALLYLFFARVLWAVWSEVRTPANARSAGMTPAAAPTPDPTPAAGAPAPSAPGGRSAKPGRGRGEVPARLVVLEPKERRGTAYAIDGTVSIGRESDNTVVVTDEYISARHARVSHDGAEVRVEDLGSRNGTFLNGTKLTQRRIVHRGDRIQVGYTVLEAQ